MERETHTEEVIVDWVRQMETGVLGAQESVCPSCTRSGADIVMRVPWAPSLGLLLPAPN